MKNYFEGIFGTSTIHQAGEEQRAQIEREKNAKIAQIQADHARDMENDRRIHAENSAKIDEIGKLIAAGDFTRATEMLKELKGRSSAAESTVKPPFKNLGGFDSWFYSDKPLAL